ncbi:MAG: hypothetical protein QG622_3251 [Actinomycetota bacterium]|nr:hypothetical protein [Actinomycetota bacterium]
MRRVVTMSMSVLAVTAALTGCSVNPFAGDSPAADSGLSGNALAPPVTTPAGVTESNYGWELVGTPSLSADMGILSARVQVRNGGTSTSAMMQLTYDLNGTPLLLQGAASNVGQGRTTTVVLASSTRVTALPKGKPVFQVTVAY